jgi:hypothetical protein
MTSARRLPGAGVGLALAAAIAALIAPVTLAQTALTNPGVRFAATQTDSLPSAEARVQSMLRGGDLELAQVAADPLIEGRTHERLVQRYRGLPVFGGVLMRQINRGFVRTIFGRIYPGINVSTQGSGEVYYTITRQFAVGGGARFSRAADDVETGTDQFVSIKTGGLQVGGGVRFLF